MWLLKDSRWLTKGPIMSDYLLNKAMWGRSASALPEEGFVLRTHERFLGQSLAFSGARWVRVPAVPHYRGVARDMIVCSLPETYSQKGTWGEYWIILESNTEMPTKIVTP